MKGWLRRFAWLSAASGLALLVAGAMNAMQPDCDTDAASGERLAMSAGRAATPRIADRSRSTGAREGHYRGVQERNSLVPRTGMRKALPVTRGQELGLRFRPDEDDSLSRQVDIGRQDGREDASQSPRSGFRPVEKRRKPTYEELQQAGRPQFPPGFIDPMPPYPVAPMVPPPAGIPPLLW